MATSPTKFARHRGQQIAYRVDGPTGGIPVVVQHGWSGSKTDFESYVDAFQDAGYRCFSIDSLGHGESDAPTERTLYGRADRAGDVIAVLDQEGVERAHMVGYSMGGWIACCVAEFHADRLLSLVIGGHCPGTGSTEEMGATGALISFDDVLTSYDFDFPDDRIPAMRHSFDVLEDVVGHDDAVAAAGVPVLLWKGRGEAVICVKGERLARERGWEFLAVDGSHIEAAARHEASLPGLLSFLANVEKTHA